MKLWKMAAAAVAMMLGAQQAQAVYVIEVKESAAGVTITGSGSVDLSGLTLVSNGAITPGVVPSQSVIAIGADAFANAYSGLNAGPNFGTGGPTFVTSVTGAFVAIDGSTNRFLVRQGYQSNQDLGTSTAFFANATIDSLGFRRGGYGVTLGTPDNQVQVYVGGVEIAVPEPATWGLMLAGFGVIGGQLRTRRGRAAFYAA